MTDKEMQRPSGQGEEGQDAKESHEKDQPSQGKAGLPSCMCRTCSHPLLPLLKGERSNRLELRETGRHVVWLGAQPCFHPWEVSDEKCRFASFDAFLGTQEDPGMVRAQHTL